jgi:hypothetical protein
MVTDIVTDDNAIHHIYAGGCWFTDEYLSKWEKVKDED